MKDEKDMNSEELEQLEEAAVEVSEGASEVNEGICSDCGEKLMKIVENRSTLDGTITFHIIKLKCPKCKKEFLDLDQAEKYDFALLLERETKQPLATLTKKLAA